MTIVKDETLFGLIHDYFKVYLPNRRQASVHTIKAYRKSMDALLDFVKNQKKIELYEIEFSMIDHRMIAAFLDSVEESGCSISTRNHRMACIRSFYKYAAKMEPLAVVHRLEVCKVPVKNLTKPDIINYMSESAVKAVLDMPNPDSTKGLRDQFFMVLLYDTGARIDELVNVRIRDIHLNATPTVTVTGKRGKTRSVPLMEKTMAHYLAYKKIFHPDENDYSRKFLFPTERGDKSKPIHQDTARKFIRIYGDEAKQICGEVPDIVHPHLFRHSRAMHLYQHGMDLTLVSQWLGHPKMETTLIYAHADTEKKRKAIEKATDPNSPLRKHLDSTRYTVSDEEQLKRLYGLR
jgi:site-specific recombinase XerD